MRPICNCGREAVVMVGPYAPRCHRHRAVGQRESTLEWDREHWRWWKTLDALCIAGGLALTVTGGLLTFVVGIPGAVNMFLGSLLATISVTIVLACLGFVDRRPVVDTDLEPLPRDYK